jgi:sugar phosphate isomerase/epimerase
MVIADNRLGIGSFAFRYGVGVPSLMPAAPITPLKFIDRVVSLGLKRIQFCENIKYIDQNEKIIMAMKQRLKESDMIVELGMYGATEENLRKHINLARKLDSKFIRLVIGEFSADSKKSVHIAAGNLKKVLDECKGEGIHIGLENHFDLTTPQIIDVIEEVNDPLVGSVFDTTNGICFLERPEETLTYMLPYIKSVHLKDFKIFKTEAGITMTGQILGQGILDVKKILRTIFAQNHDASIIIELTIRRNNELSVEQVIEEENEQITCSVDCAKRICDELSGSGFFLQQ